MNRARRGNPDLVTSQINAESASSADAAPDGRDAWDRLAALAFDQSAAHEGCSAQAHECACRAEHSADAAEPAVPPSSDL